MNHDRISLDYAALSSAIEQAPPHLAPIWLAVRDHGVAFGLLPQGHEPSRFAAVASPTITLVGDDTSQALGPGGFHGESLGRVFVGAGVVVIVACPPHPPLYAAAAITAIFGESAVIIETRPAEELPWIEYVLATCPGVRILVGTTTVGRPC